MKINGHAGILNNLNNAIKKGVKKYLKSVAAHAKNSSAKDTLEGYLKRQGFVKNVVKRNLKRCVF